MELASFLAVVGSALWLLRKPSRALRPWVVAVGLYVVLGGVVGQQLWERDQQRRRADAAELRGRLPVKGRAGGYVSSDNCRSCHPSEHASWHQSFHRGMTQLAGPETVKADFRDVTLENEGRVYKLSRTDEQFFIKTDDGPPQRVGMLTGSHHMQVFWLPGDLGNQQVEFPFTYLLDDQRWVKRRDVFLISSRFQKHQSVWNSSCIECHATGGQPRLKTSDGAVEGTIRSAAQRELTPTTRVGELGIACEACHGPGYAHVVANLDPVRRFARHLKGEGDPTIVNPARLPAPASAQVCGQCHSIACNLRGWSWDGLAYQPGNDLARTKPMIRAAEVDSSDCRDQIRQDPSFVDTRFWSDGMPRVSGREYSSLIESKCFHGGTLSCQSCHSMHQGDPNQQLTPQMRGAQACLQCHPAFTGPKLAEHTRHAPSTAGSDCYNCHMPRTTYGLLKALSSHTIDSPSVQKTLATGRPNACNLCHLDKSLTWTAEKLSSWYGIAAPVIPPDRQKISVAARDALSGDAGQRALIAWSLGWKESQRASGLGWQEPYLAQLMVDSYAAVRYVAKTSLRGLPGYADFPYDYVGTPGHLERASQQVLQRWREGRPKSAVDELTEAEWTRLLNQRDDKGMFLAE